MSDRRACVSCGAARGCLRAILLAAIVLIAVAGFQPALAADAGKSKQKTTTTSGKGTSQKTKEPAPAEVQKAAPRVRQEVKPSSGSSKVDDFLRKLEGASSMDEVRRAYEAARFSKSEIQQLGRVATKQPYMDKLTRLRRSERTKSRGPTHPPMVNAKQLRERRQRELDSEHRRQLAHRARQLETTRAAARRRLPAHPTARLEAQTPGRSGPSTHRDSTSLPGPASSAASITSVTPGTAQVGRNLTVRGAGLGAPGRVGFLIRGGWVEAERVVSWSDGQIVVTVPPGVGEAVGETETGGRLWVKLAGGETGPMHDLRFLPDHSQLEPEIVALSSSEVIPGDGLLIQGRNFLSSRPGTVELQLAGSIFPLDVRSWNDDELEVRVPNIVGLMREAGRIVVQNHLDLETSRPITFLPRIATQELWGPGEDGHGIMSVSCSPHYGQHAHDDPRWLACIIGWTEEHRTRMRLQNGWEVFSGGHERRTRQGWQSAECGAYYAEAPERGSRTIESTNVIWTNGWASCTFAEVLVIEGPAGVAWNAPYDAARARIDR